MKAVNREILFNWCDIYGIKHWFKWYHTTGFMRFQLLQLAQMRSPAISYVQYIFWGESAKRIEIEKPIGYQSTKTAPYKGLKVK